MTDDDITWTWEADCSGCVARFRCDECGREYERDATITSELSADGSQVNFMASITLGENTFTDTKTAAPITVAFEGDAGVASIDVYHTRDYGKADESGVAGAVAREGSGGHPVLDGTGEVNFVVRLNEGFSVDAVTASGGSVVGPSETGAGDTYRITGLTADATVTVTTKERTYKVSYEFVSGTGALTCPRKSRRCCRPMGRSTRTDRP